MSDHEPPVTADSVNALYDLAYREHFDGDLNCACAGCLAEQEIWSLPQQPPHKNNWTFNGSK